MPRLQVITLTLAVLVSAINAQASNLYGVQYAGRTDLYSVNQGTGAVTPIGPTGQDNIGDLTSDTRAGSATVWGVRIPSNELLAFDPVTGAAGAGVTMNSPNSMVSIAFDVVTGRLFGNTSVGFGAPFDALYEIAPATGNATFIGRILFENVFALGFDQTGKLFGIADATDQLISINTATGNGALIANLTLGLSFDIASRPEDDVMFLADSGTSSLYTLDTATGATASVGPYGANLNIVGLAFGPGGSRVPDAGATFALLGLALGGLGLVRRR